MEYSPMNTKLTFLALVLLSGQAAAHDPGTWIGRVGLTNVDPKSDNSAIVDVEAGAALNLNAVFFSMKTGLWMSSPPFRSITMRN